MVQWTAMKVCSCLPGLHIVHTLCVKSSLYEVWVCVTQTGILHNYGSFSAVWNRDSIFALLRIHICKCKENCHTLIRILQWTIKTSVLGDKHLEVRVSLKDAARRDADFLIMSTTCWHAIINAHCDSLFEPHDMQPQVIIGRIWIHVNS